MQEKDMTAQIHVLETQIESLKKSLKNKKKAKGKKFGLRSLEEILKGKAHFTEEDIESVKVKWPGNKEKMKPNCFPPGWDIERVRRVIAHYDRLSEEEAVAQDEAAYENPGQSMIEVPSELIPKIRNLIAQTQSEKRQKKRSARL